MQKPTISVPEMAAELGIGLTKAYQLVHEPNFPTIRIGTRILIPVDRFHEWLTQEKVAYKHHKQDTTKRKYMGDALLQKTITTDFLTKTKIMVLPLNTMLRMTTKPLFQKIYSYWYRKNL